VSDDPKTNWLLKTWMRVIEQKTGKYYYPTEEPYQVYVLATSLSTAVVTTVGYALISRLATVLVVRGVIPVHDFE
jgi:hypothetical protein